MAVRRLHPDQPASFAFTAENLGWAKETIAKYPTGRQASAVIPLLWRAQEQHANWLPEPAIRYVGDMLGMAYIRVYEVATFYTMFQLSPVGRKAHVQVCGTTPCMLRGAEAIRSVCQSKIHHDPHHLSADGNFSWEEVECLGSCANAPMVQIFKETYEDLTHESFEKVLDGYAAGKPPKVGSQIGRKASSPFGGQSSLTDPALFDGSGVGAWQKKFLEAAAAATAAAATAVTSASTAPASAAPAPAAAKAPATPAPATAAPATASTSAPLAAATFIAATGPGKRPPLLASARDGKGDDLSLIWGVAEKLQKKLNENGIWHFDQIAAWTPLECMWIEAHIEGMQGRLDRDRWIEQAKKLASGWRPENAHGERTKG
jgi:NADH-quinone oxidoreductase subunit E